MSQLVRELRELVDDLVPEAAEAGAAAETLTLWDRIRELGLPRVGIPEDEGGSGGTLDDLVVVIEALARHGVGVPIVEASAADWVLGGARTAGGSSWSTLTLVDGTPRATRGSVTAELRAVPWARHADRLVVCGTDSAPLAVDLHHESVTVRHGENLAGEPRDTVTLTGTPVVIIAAAPTGAQIRTRLALLWSAAVLGAAHGAYRLTKTYVAGRRQFGAPLLDIPAVATNLALMRVNLVQAEAAVAHARDATPGTADTAACVARITTAAAATEIARIAHQLHGAMGITQEYPLHRYTRRLWAWRDAVAYERHWSQTLGRRAATGGEDAVWTELTFAGP